jgi:hypothetical protein
LLKKFQHWKERKPWRRNSAKIADGSQSLFWRQIGKDENPGKNGNHGEEFGKKGGGAERILELRREIEREMKEFVKVSQVKVVIKAISKSKIFVGIG